MESKRYGFSPPYVTGRIPGPNTFTGTYRTVGCPCPKTSHSQPHPLNLSDLRRSEIDVERRRTQKQRTLQSLATQSKYPTKPLITNRPECQFLRPVLRQPILTINSRKPPMTQPWVRCTAIPGPAASDQGVVMRHRPRQSVANASKPRSI